MHPAQAAAIVSALERVPDTVAVENLDAAERQLVNLARTFTPSQLRDAAQRMRNILDPDGPEPDENRAYHRESLTLKPADHGVKFGGYLANENAELFRTLIHSGAKPHKTIDGHPDPRARDKRQADALTTLLNTAAAITHTTATSTTSTTDNRNTANAAGNRDTAGATGDRSTAPTAGNRSTAPTAGHRNTANATGSRNTASTAGDRSTAAPGDRNTANATGDRNTGNTFPADRPTAGEPRDDHDSASHLRQPIRNSTSTGTSARTDAAPETGDSTSTADNSDHRAREDLPQVDTPATHDTSSHEAPTHEAPTHEAPTHEAPTHEAPTHEAPSQEASSRDASGREAFGQYIPGHGPKAHLTITIDYHALKAATADATGQTVFGDDLSAATVRRLACDAQAIPIVLGTKSQPLDVGTTKRLVTAPMRLALNARDRGCVVCGAPPIQCEAHHLMHWIDGGTTSVSNLVLLCKRHHIDLHTGHWHIQIINDVVHVTRPGWATPDPIPPNKYRPPLHHDPTNNSPDTAARPWTPATTRHRETTPDAARQAIWGDPTPPTEPGPSPVSPPPYDPWSDEAPSKPSTDQVVRTTTGGG